MDTVFLSIIGTILIVLMSALVFLLRQDSSKTVCVVVLGDIGRSPRMQYHSLSLVAAGYTVHLIGYGDSIPHAAVVNSEQIHMTKMIEPPKLLQRLPRLVLYVMKVLWQSCTLLGCLLCCSRPSHILLQNPPAMPSLAVCCVVSLLRGATLVVDWHNYGYTLLALSLSPAHLLVRISEAYERFFGRFSASNICVTNAMQQDLCQNWQINAVTMYDRPPCVFKVYDLDTQFTLFCKLAQQYDVFRLNPAEPDVNGEGSCFLQRSTNGVEHRVKRPALLVSSTSWTEDEDFSILLNALDIYDRTCHESSDPILPDVVCAITGKGPLKEHYGRLIRQRAWKHVSVCTPWLLAEDYPVLLGSADIGICLHKSSSGLDLPMKVVDMFGCCLPVCAVNFDCLSELVKHEENGLVFGTEQELANQLQELLSGFPDKCTKLGMFRENLKLFQQTRWAESWNQHVLPLFL